MSRVKRGVTTHARHRKVIKKAKGYYGARKNTHSAPLVRLLRKPANMPIATAGSKSVISDRFGSSASMPAHANMG